MHCVLEFNQSWWLKPYIKFNTQKRMEAEKINDRHGDALYKLMNNDIHGKAMENLRNRIDVKPLNNKKDYLKCTSKPSYMSHKKFDNNLAAIHKSKLAWKLNKLACIELRILKLREVLTYKFHFDYTKNTYDNKSQLLLTVIVYSLMYEIKTEDVYEDFSSN